MTTFSQLVDSIVMESLRPDQQLTIISYANQTIRELHTERASGAAVGFTSNLKEVELVANVDERFVYTLPTPHLFQKMESIYYPGRGKYAVQRYPSSAMRFRDQVDGKYYWYRAGSDIAMSGFGGIDSEVYMAWFEFPRRLTYYKPALRPATWNDETQQFTYLPAYQGTPELQLQALSLSTNWMLDRWEDTVGQGTRAKLYTRLADDVRSRTAYSMYESHRSGLVSAETHESAPRYSE